MKTNELKKVLERCMSDFNCVGCPLQHVGGCMTVLIEESYDALIKYDLKIQEAINEFADKIKYAYSQYEEVLPEMFSEDVDDIAKEVLYNVNRKTDD